MDHFDGRRFFNPTGANGQPLRAIPRLLREKRTPWPKRLPTLAQQPPPPNSATDVVVTFIGHSTFLIQSRAGNILTDPVYATRAGPFSLIGPKRVRPPGVNFDDLPEISVVLLSHNHYDHCDLRTLKALDRRFQPLVVAPLGNRRLLQSAGVHRIGELDWWEAATAAPVPIMLTPAQHFSARGPFDRNRALWGGFMFSIANRQIFFAGDSGYGPHFSEIRRRTGPIDLALIPIGAYEPRWFMRDIHMNPAEAVQAHLDVEARQSIGMHFGMFQLTSEAITAPVTELTQALAARGVPAGGFRVMDCGESLHLADLASR